jgi:hypothetical protein
VHQKERPFKCNFCGTSFGQKVHMDSHISAVHNQVINLQVIARLTFKRPVGGGGGCQKLTCPGKYSFFSLLVYQNVVRNEVNDFDLILGEASPVRPVPISVDDQRSLGQAPADSS